MKKLAIAITAVAAFTGSAVAADMQVKAQPYAPPVVTAYNWTGCYVGAGGGYGMYNQDVSADIFGTGSGTTTLGGRGWFGTGQVGCDYQVMPSIVIGAFGDYNFGSIKGTTFSVDEKLSSSWAAGGRIGWVALPNLLAYVSGGYTEARFDQIDITRGGGGGSGYIPATTYKGWFLGSGYEYGLGFMPGLFWKTEYRFADYQADTVPIAPTSGSSFSFDSHKYVQTIRSELVYRFNWH